MHMDMIFADDAFADADIFSIADLQEQVSASQFDVTCQDMVAVFRAPHDMCRQSCDGMSTMPVLFHQAHF